MVFASLTAPCQIDLFKFFFGAPSTLLYSLVICLLPWNVNSFRAGGFAGFCSLLSLWLSEQVLRSITVHMYLLEGEGNE